MNNDISYVTTFTMAEGDIQSSENTAVIEVSQITSDVTSSYTTYDINSRVERIEHNTDVMALCIAGGFFLAVLVLVHGFLGKFLNL